MMNKYHAILAESVAKMGKAVKTYTAEQSEVIDNFCLSASGHGKYRLFVNGELVATMFSSRHSRQCFYPLQIPLNTGDLLSVEFRNLELSVMDMYGSFRRNPQ